MTLFCIVASLKVPAIIINYMATKVLDTETFPQHNISGLISGIRIVLFSQEIPLPCEEINTHTYTHTHTHTHPHTHKLLQ